LEESGRAKAIAEKAPQSQYQRDDDDPGCEAKLEHASILQLRVVLGISRIQNTVGRSGVHSSLN
jgi:hypothetical protein